MAKKAAKKKRETSTELTAREALFVAEYLKDLNATNAAIRAGYSQRTAAQQGSRLLKNVKVGHAIAKANEERLSRVNASAESLLTRLIEESNADQKDIFNPDGSFKPIHEWPAIWRRGLVSGVKVEALYAGEGEDRKQVGTVTEVKFSDRTKRLHLTGQHTMISAFKKNVEHNVAKPLQELFEQIQGKSIRPGGST